MSQPILAAYCTDGGIERLNEADAKKIDIFYYCFIRVNEKGDFSFAELNHADYLPRLREMNPDMKIVLTFASEGAGLGLCTHGKAACDAVAQKMVRTAIDLDFDGIDVDWEFPGDPTRDMRERENYILLICSLREQMDKLSPDRRLLLSLAVPATGFCFDSLEGCIDLVDYVNLMTYDINAGVHYTVHHTPPRRPDTDIVRGGSVEEGIAAYLSLGVPREKMLLGAAWYSRTWHNVRSDTDGLYAYAGEKSDYGPDYPWLKNEFINKNGYVRYWDDTAKAPYLFNGEHFITYDDPDSVREKCKMVSEFGVAGIMVWEYRYDTDHTLLSLMREALDN